MKIYARVRIPDSIRKDIYGTLQSLAERYKIPHAGDDLHWTIKAPFTPKDRHYKKVLKLFSYHSAKVRDKKLRIGGVLCFGDWTPEVLTNTKIGDPKGLPKINHITMGIRLSDDLMKLHSNIIRDFEEGELFPSDYYTEMEQWNIPHISLLNSLTQAPEWKAKAVRDAVHRSPLFRYKNEFEATEIEILGKITGRWQTIDLIPLGPSA